MRHRSRSTVDLADQLEHTETVYELIRDGEVVASERHVRSPATRWYTQAQARDLYRRAGFNDVRVVRQFTHEPAAESDRLFCVLGVKD